MHLKVSSNRWFLKIYKLINDDSDFSEDHTVVEPLKIPDGAAPGDRVSVEGYQGTPDAQLNPKKKVSLSKIRF